MARQSPYIDANNVDRTQEIEKAFWSTLEDIKNDPFYYAELVNDLLFFYLHGTSQTPLMTSIKNK